LVEVDLAYPETPSRVSLRDAKGRSTPVQVLERSEVRGKQHVRYLFIARDVPSLGYAVYHLAPEEQAPENASSSLIASASALENDALRVEIDPASGWVSRIFDKHARREVLDDSGKGNQLLAIEDEGDSEGRFVLGKDKAPRPPGQAVEIDSTPAIQLLENGPVRATLRVEKAFRNSRFVQTISLAAGIPRVDFTLDIDWHDVHTMIKVAFPFALKDPEVTYDAPYAAIVRPADGNEYPAQKWVDMCADGSGVGLLNDARYAHDAQGSVLRMSVLRSPTQPANNTDEGSHTLGYAIYPHKDSWKKANVLRQGYAFNYPLMARVEPPHEGDWPAQRSFFAVEPNNVLLEVVKKAYDSDAVIVRLCEMHGEKAAARLTLPASVLSASETDLIETPLRELGVSGNALELSMSPYEIKTIRIELKP
jgi:alpha-mannosidase